MPYKFNVKPLKDNEDSSYQNLQLTHRDCGGGKINIHRNPASDEQTMHCVCGLEIIFSNGDAGLVQIMGTAITGVPSTIRSNLIAYPDNCPLITIEQKSD